MDYIPHKQPTIKWRLPEPVVEVIKEKKGILSRALAFCIKIFKSIF